MSQLLPTKKISSCNQINKLCTIKSKICRNKLFFCSLLHFVLFHSLLRCCVIFLSTFIWKKRERAQLWTLLSWMKMKGEEKRAFMRCLWKILTKITFFIIIIIFFSSKAKVFWGCVQCLVYYIIKVSTVCEEMKEIKKAEIPASEAFAHFIS